jgi:polysaccharide biosynthesis transport protein
MSILQFLRIFWARWITIVVTTVCAAVGAYVVAVLVPPRYEATAPVLLNLSKPDPVTGQAINMRGSQPYIETQRELIRDYRVTGRVVDRLGWLTDPGLVSAYQARSSADSRDFRRWLAQRVADNIELPLRGTNIMEIKYRGGSAEEAKLGAETLRDEYLQVSVLDRQGEAQRSAAWYSAQADKAREAAEQAELAKAAFEKQSGIIMADNNADFDSARLAAMAGQASASASVPAAAAAMSSASLALSQLDAEIAQESQRLGANHPRMQQLRQRREQAAKIAAQEQAAMRAAASGASGAEVVQRALEAQKSRVVSQRDKVERLRQLQSEVELLRDEYKRTAARAAQLRLEAGMTEPLSSPVGLVVAPKSPVFPNKPLMVGGATALGATLGFALSLLLELLNRRVRGVEDLNISGDIRCIGVFEEPEARTRNAIRRMIKSLLAIRTRVAT